MQLSLPVLLKDRLSFDNFVVGDNQQLVDHLIAVASAVEQSPALVWLTYCFAESGLGKSHLLFASSYLAEQSQQSCVYLSFRDKSQLSLEMLEGLEAYSLICLDDIECIEDDLAWQVALFDLINRIKEQGQSRLILCARFPLQALPLQLPDLLSRLSWGVSFRIVPLNDNERCKALILRAEQRGLVMSLEVAKYLLNHLQRDLPALIACLDKLDELSLQQQRKLTIPFVKSTLDL
ncbi:DnaA regulatory inactivator Hda [Paraglaciecola hydrolytica]|uniref:DnaA regulatory inactivator Hda n=2 Tax=Paraglaciecola hydrolytica TaxID=1799789 RepID=A0A136A2K9_9ALTE|nr:DnaA regulatory inactivator Hda [Paraglaciecola hydrolytica]